ncbi:protein kinase domain-containing protein [Nocardia iowensis]|uniref:Caspase family protein n=1 Tax=Nocardia iowensis TaxID=204891 RepID=A0ABX8RTZ0_NOCIO|nr:protein kinase [Nocardia iowensis]QXN93108.1 caspase family protein [Nocardia iowensis]
MIKAAKKRAIIVGVNEHPTDPLVYPTKDANDIATLLSMRELNFEVTVLLEHEATRSAVLDTFGELRREPPDVLLFYFSGHGFTTQWDTVYLHTYGALRADEGLDVHELARVLQKQQEMTATTLAILDCCHAGAMTAWADSRPVDPGAMDAQLTLKAETHAVLAACRPGGQALSAVSSHNGAFTSHVLDGLSGNAADHKGNVTIDDLASYVRRQFISANQVVVYRTESAGQGILGQGYTPVAAKPFTGADIEQFGKDAEAKLTEYQMSLAQFSAHWAEDGYADACRTLRPIARWFDGKTKKNPELNNSPKIQTVRERINAKRAFLQNLEPDITFDGKRVVRSLGSGSFGSVWLVDSGGHQIAFKVYKGDEFGDRRKRAMFERGYHAMEQLNHPRVVKVHGQTTVPVGFFMDYIEGESLATFPTPTDDPGAALRLLILAAETVQHAHAAGVVHRDIKPENLLVSLTPGGAWEPYLTDFDLSWFSNASKLASQAMAPVAYCAPEYFEHPESELARRNTVDTYSFAQLAYFLMVGSSPLPFRTAENANRLRGRTKGWFVGEAASAFVEFYAMCSNYDPRSRPQQFVDLIEMLVDIETLLSGERDDQLTRDQFFAEIQFSLRALPGESISGPGSTFKSISGRTDVVISVEHESRTKSETYYSIKVQLQLHELRVNVVRNEKARTILNKRVDNELRKFPGASKVFGSHGVYEVFIRLPNVAGNMAGVRYARSAIQRVIGSIEGT